MKSKTIFRITALTAVITATLASLQAADITLGTGTYTDTQTYNNGTISGPVTFNAGANYTFDSLSLPLAWNRVILNSGAALTVGGNINVDFSGLSLNGGTLTTGGLLLHDSPNWAGTINDGKQSIEQGDTIINGATLVANQSNANFISFIGSSSHPEWNPALANNVWLGSDGATIDSNGHNIGITMALGNFFTPTGKLTKTGAGTLTLSANNSYAAGTTVNGGVLEIAGSNAGNSYIRGTVTVNSGAELRYTGGDGTGFGFANKLDTININGGLVNSQGNMAHLWGATVNMTGGELRVNDGVSSATGYRLEWNQSAVNTLASTSAATISGRINLRGDGGYSSVVFSVEDGTAATDLLVSAAITQSSAVGITKNGDGTMELSGANSYTGTTRVNGGVLQLDSAFLSDSSPVIIGFGAKVSLNHVGNDVIGSLVIDGVTVPSGSYNASHPTYGTYFAGTGTLVVGAPGPQVGGTWISSTDGNWSDSANWQSAAVANGTDNTATFNPGAPVTATVDGNRFIGALVFTGSNATLAGADVLTLDNSSLAQPQVDVASGVTATLSTNIGGTLGLEKTGSGTLKFTGSKSYTGGTTVTGGTLELSGATGGNAQIHGSVTVNAGGTLSFTDGDGTGFGFFNNPANSIVVDGGTIQAVSGSHLGFGPFMTMTMDNGGTIIGSWQWNGDGLLAFSSYGDSTNTISGNVVLRADSGANHTFNVNDGASATDLAVSANLSDQWPEVTWLSASGLTKSGTGTMVLSGTNSYDGNTVINGGTLQVSSLGSLRFRPAANGSTNSVSGSATAAFSFLGTVSLDLTAAAANVGNSWNLFNLASFTGPVPTLNPAAVTTTTLGSFTEVSPGVWELPVTGAKWVFTAATGTLAYVNAASPYETWGAAYGLSAGSEGGDLDNDGLTNFQEFAFGLIPNSGSSVNPITSQLNKTAGQFTYQRLAASGLTYTIWTSPDLVNWTQDFTASQVATPAGNNESVVVTLTGPLPASKLFVRVKAQ